MTALVVLPSRGDLRRLSGGDVGPDEVGEVVEDPDERYDRALLAPDGETANNDDGDDCCGWF